MRIANFSVLGHLKLELVFEDGCRLHVVFDGGRLAGSFAPLSSEIEFYAAYLSHGTVAWPCGASLDNEVARIRADEVEVWRPV